MGMNMNYRYMNYRYTLGVANRSTYRFLVTAVRAVLSIFLIGALMFGFVAFVGAAVAFVAALIVGGF